MEEINLSNAILYADSARGVYIPQYFAESIKRECVRGIEGQHNWEDISDAFNEYYWQSWTVFLDSVTVIGPDTGIEYGLWQDGDLWLVPLVDLYASDSEDSV